MKKIALFLALAIALPLGASAQVPPPAGPPHHTRMTQAQRTAFQTAFKSFHDKDAALRAQNRKAVLGALSPGSRALLAQVAGRLATADVPDRKAAAAELDGKLSSGEKQAILAANTDFRTQSKALYEQFGTQMKSMMPSPSPGSHPHPHAWPSGKPHGDHHRTPPTAGSILLMTALGGMHGGMMMHGRGMMMHGQGHPK